jgi:hypothetical protein
MPTRALRRKIGAALMTAEQKDTEDDGGRTRRRRRAKPASDSQPGWRGWIAQALAELQRAVQGPPGGGPPSQGPPGG